MSRFVDELKRRGVIRAAILYVGFAFGTLEVVEMLGPRLGFPESTFMYVFTFFAVGFPVAMWLSWRYQFGLSGISSESDAESAVPVPESQRRRSDKVIIAVLAFAVVAFLVNIIVELPPPPPPPVNTLVELGQEQLIQRTENSVIEAEKTFRRAIEINENFAPAYAGLAEALFLQLIWGLAPTADSRAEIQAVIDIGMELDHEIGALYANQAVLKWERDNDLDAAETLLLQAIELSPDDALGYRWYAELLAFGRGDWKKALPQIEKGLELLPNDPDLVNMFARAKRSMGDGVEALPLLRETVQLHSEDLRMHSHIAQILKYEQGRIGESLKWSKHISKENPKNFRRRFLLECWAWMLFQELDEVRKCTRKLEQDFKAFPKRTLAARLMYYDAIGDQNKIAEEVNALMHSGPAETVMQRDSADSENITHLLGGMIPDVLVDKGMWDLARRFKEWQGNPVFTDPDWEPSRDDVHSIDNIGNAIINGAILYQTGDKEEGDQLLDFALDRINDEDLTLMAGYSYRQVWVHAIRGDESAAEAYLKVTIVDQWNLEDWHRLRSPVFDLIADEQEWKDLLASLEARAAEELAWYEKHKDEPLY